MHGVKDGEDESKMQHNKEVNINKDNSSADNCLHMNAATEDNKINQLLQHPQKIFLFPTLIP